MENNMRKLINIMESALAEKKKYPEPHTPEYEQLMRTFRELGFARKFCDEHYRQLHTYGQENKDWFLQQLAGRLEEPVKVIDGVPLSKDPDAWEYRMANEPWHPLAMYNERSGQRSVEDIRAMIVSMDKSLANLMQKHGVHTEPFNFN